MIVLNQAGDTLFDFQKASVYTTDIKGRAFAKFPNGDTSSLGYYDDQEHAKFALGMLAAAYADGVAKFEMPDKLEIRETLMNKSSNPIRKRFYGKSHGGS